jgi:alpha-galactosidase
MATSSRKKGLKIVFVGGGSYNWGPTILSDLGRESVLEGAEVVLLDVNLKAAREIAAAAARMAKTLKRAFTFTATTSQSRAFKGADFVLITISTGGLDAMAHDLEVPEKFGVLHTVGDTCGPGGWSRALRNIPVFVQLAQAIEKHAPTAVVLNYTNPMGALTGVLHECSSLRSVGLCHGVFATYRLLQNLFNVEESDLALRFGGVNHFFWVTDFTVNGEPGYPLLKECLQDQSLDTALAHGDSDEMGFHSHHALCDELYRRTGYLGYAGDRHTCEFVPDLLSVEGMSTNRFKLERTSIGQRRDKFTVARQRALDLAAGKSKPPKRSRETAVDIIKAFVTNKPFTDVVNLPNTGQIDNLPRRAVVETPGRIDALGFAPITIGSLPPILERMVRPHCEVQLLTLEAGLRGDRELAIEALLADPLCAHVKPSDVRQMGQELLDANSEFLPQFQ